MVAVRGTHTVDVGTGTASDLTVDLSTAGAQAGDFAIIVAEFSANGATLTVDRADWDAHTNVNLSTTFSGRAFSKVLTAGDITDDTVTITGASSRAAAGLIVLSDPGDLDSVATNPTGDSDAANDTAQPIPGIDPVADSMVITVQAVNYAAGGTQVTAPASWTRRFNEATAHGSGRRAGVAAFTFDTNPTTSSVSAVSSTSDANAHSAAWTFAVNEASSAAEVTPDDATHAHSAESPTVTQLHLVTPADGTHAHSAESPAITQLHIVQPADASHAHSAESPTISVTHTVTPNDATHGHSAESPTITQLHVVAPADATHAHTAESPTVEIEAIEIVVADALHAHTAESPTVTQVHTVEPDDATHDHTVDSPVVVVVVPAPVPTSRTSVPVAQSLTSVARALNRTATPSQRSTQAPVSASRRTAQPLSPTTIASA